MESLTYLTKEIITIPQIGEIASKENYDYVRYSEDELQIRFPSDPERTCFFTIMREKEHIFDSKEEEQNFLALNSKTIVAVEFRYSSLDGLAQFLKLILTQYDGWVEADGEYQHFFTKETIENLPIYLRHSSNREQQMASISPVLIQSYTELASLLRNFRSWNDSSVYDFNGIGHLWLELLDNLQTHAVEEELIQISYSITASQREFLLKLADYAGRTNDA
ncbi:MAG: hypothetical protein RLP44_10540 [Aggregatilineales bacterium]